MYDGKFPEPEMSHFNLITDNNNAPQLFFFFNSFPRFCTLALAPALHEPRDHLSGKPETCSHYFPCGDLSLQVMIESKSLRC